MKTKPLLSVVQSNPGRSIELMHDGKAILPGLLIEKLPFEEGLMLPISISRNRDFMPYSDKHAMKSDPMQDLGIGVLYNRLKSLQC